MILLNFSHPITKEQRAQIEAKTEQSIDRTITVATHFDDQQPYEPQLRALVAQVGLTSEQWQGAPILVVLPSLNFIAASLLADLHGRMGYFPPVVRIRPVAGSIPPRFEVAEILNLQSIREESRRTR